jgi:hypothetical protein
MSRVEKLMNESNAHAEKLIKANVGKYIYHLTRKYARERIEKEGLRNNANSAEGYVFAHNTNRFDTDWYWFCFDSYELDLSHFYGNELQCMIDYKSELRCCVSHFYDIWRIDTDIAGKEWYIDYKGLKDMPNRQEDYYIKHKGGITPKALTLCCLDKTLETQKLHTEIGLEITYFNPIIPLEEYRVKHGFKPENEFTLVANDPRNFVMHSEDQTSQVYWKKLNRMHFSLLEEIAMHWVA